MTAALKNADNGLRRFELRNPDGKVLFFGRSGLGRDFAEDFASASASGLA